MVNEGFILNDPTYSINLAPKHYFETMSIIQPKTSILNVICYCMPLLNSTQVLQFISEIVQAFAKRFYEACREAIPCYKSRAWS